MSPVITNSTPWPSIMFERGDAADRRYWVLVHQASFALDGDQLQPTTPQEPIHLADTFWVQNRPSSVRRPGIAGLRKPNSDVTVNAAARSAVPQTEWAVRLRLGAIDSTLLVRGPHVSVYDDQGWTLTEPQPCTSVALVYENAFGGSGTVDGRYVEEPRNPLGTGFMPEDLDDPKTHRAPQVGAPDDPPHEPGQTRAPRGWGAIPAYFAPRVHHVGTCDAAWERTRWPLPPSDFDDAFYQAAHPDLIYPGDLVGDEFFRLDGVSASGLPIRGRLPGWRVYSLVAFVTGDIAASPARLDHVHIDVLSPDPAQHRVYLTWRTVMLKTPLLRSVETRMASLSEVGDCAA